MARLGEETVELDVMMERLSDHLDALATKVFEIEEALGKTLEQQTTEDHDFVAITRLQSLDYLRQSLEDLALLSCFMSKNSQRANQKGFTVSSLADGLRLDSTRSVVFAAAKLETHVPTSEGDLDLF